jgi:hypothetical protein
MSEANPQHTTARRAGPDGPPDPKRKLISAGVQDSFLVASFTSHQHDAVSKPASTGKQSVGGTQGCAWKQRARAHLSSRNGRSRLGLRAGGLQSVKHEAGDSHRASAAQYRRNGTGHLRHLGELYVTHNLNSAPHWGVIDADINHHGLDPATGSDQRSILSFGSDAADL